MCIICDPFVYKTSCYVNSSERSHRHMLPLRISLSKSTSPSMPNSVPPPKPNLSVGEPDLYLIRIPWVLWVVGSRDPCRSLDEHIRESRRERLIWIFHSLGLPSPQRKWSIRIKRFRRKILMCLTRHGHGLGLSVGWVGSNFWATVVGWVDSHSSSPIFVYSNSIINRIQTDRLLSCCNRRHYTV